MRIVSFLLKANSPLGTPMALETVLAEILQDYVSNGHQTNTRPNWLAEKSAESGGTVTIGNHVFAGRAQSN